MSNHSPTGARHHGWRHRAADERLLDTPGAAATSAARRSDQPRTFGVEEELLLVDAAGLRPAALGELIASSGLGAGSTGHELSTELKQEQIEVICPPQTSLRGQLATIRTGRALADQAAAAHGGRVVALSTSPWPTASDIVPAPRNDRIGRAFGLTASEQLTCGMHVHVGIGSAEEGIAALDRLRVWLPAVLALSANSPFWMGQDSGFASYRYQAWGRWPTSGPTELFGTPAAYEHHRAALLRSAVPLDDGMLYHDARLSVRYPTLEVRVADVCLLPEHAAAIAAVVRALVETCVRQARDGVAPVPVSTSLLRTWSWRASRYGVDEQLVDPTTGDLAPAPDVTHRLLEFVAAALVEYGEFEPVSLILHDIVRNGPGAVRQRGLLPDPHTLDEGDIQRLLAHAVQATQGDSTVPSREPAGRTPPPLGQRRFDPRPTDSAAGTPSPHP